MLNTGILVSTFYGAFLATRSHGETVMGRSATQARRRTMQAMRTLQSEECNADTSAIFDRSLALRQAARAFDPEYADAVEACGDNRSCTIDEDAFAATPDFVRECEAAGGVIYEYDMIVDCAISDTEGSVSVKISYLNVDHCFAPSSCDRQAIAGQAQDEVNADLGEFESVFTDETARAVCNVKYTVSDQQGNTVTEDRIEGNGVSGSVGLRVAVSFVSSWMIVATLLN